MKSIKIIAMMVVGIMAMAAMVPAIYEPASEDSEAVAASAGVLAFGPAGSLILIGGAFAAGVAVGYFWGKSVQVPESNDEYYKAALRSAEAEIAYTAAGTAGNIFLVMLPTDAEMVGFTTDHFQRVQEYSVADQWTLMGDYHANDLMARNGTAGNLATYIHNWQSVIDSSYAQIFTREGEWKGQAMYDSVKVQILADGAELLVNRPAPKSNLDFLTVATPTEGKDTVYVYANNGENPVEEGGRSMYLIGGAGELQGRDGTRYPMAEGKNDIGSLAPGYYRLAPGVTYAGPMTQSGERPAQLSAGAMITSGAKTTLLTVSDGKIRNGNTEISALDWDFSYQDKDGNVKKAGPEGGAALSLGDTLLAWGTLIDRIGKVTAAVTLAGEVLWGLYDVAETSVDAEGNKVYLSPSSILPQTDTPLPPDMARKLAAMTLKQASGWYESNKTAVDGMKINVSLDGLDLLVQGDVYRNGTLLLKDAVFSLYAYEQDVAVKKGVNDWNQAGLAFVFGTTDNFEGYTPGENSSMLPLDSSMEIDVKAMKSKGTTVESYDLTLNRIFYREGKELDHGDPAEEAPPVKSDHGVLFMIILLEAAALLGIAAYYTRMPAFAILAALVAIVGLAASGWIWDVYAGNVGIWDWLPKWRPF